MKWTPEQIVTVIGLLLGSTVIATVLGKLLDIWLDRKKRKDTIADRKETTDERIDDTEDTIEELRAETTEQFKQVNDQFTEVNQRLDKQGEKLDGICNNSIVRTYNEIRREALAAIRQGSIEAEKLRELIELYEGYKKLPGANGYLEQIMIEVRRLRIIPPKE